MSLLAAAQSSLNTSSTTSIRCCHLCRSVLPILQVIRVSQYSVLRQYQLPSPRLQKEEGLGKGQQVVTWVSCCSKCDVMGPDNHPSSVFFIVRPRLVNLRPTSGQLRTTSGQLRTTSGQLRSTTVSSRPYPGQQFQFRPTLVHNGQHISATVG